MTKKMITFHGSIDVRSRAVTVPTVARLLGRFGDHIEMRYIVIGTAYNYLYTVSGGMRTWLSYSGARKAARNYKPGV